MQENYMKENQGYTAVGVNIKIKMFTRVTNILKLHFKKILIRKTVTPFWNCNLRARGKTHIKI